MKKAKRILIFALIAAISLSFATPALASETDVLPEESTVITEGTPEASEALEGKNSFFEELLSALGDYSAEILSALAFVGSIIIMLCYKRGLLPIINDALKALKSGIKSVADKSDSFTEHALGVCDSIDERLKSATLLSEEVLKSAELTRSQLSELKSTEKSYENLKLILASQIDMLYEVFMSAALPQYLKDNVGEKIGEMKAALGKEESNETLN